MKFIKESFERSAGVLVAEKGIEECLYNKIDNMSKTRYVIIAGVPVHANVVKQIFEFFGHCEVIADIVGSNEKEFFSKVVLIKDVEYSGSEIWPCVVCFEIFKGKQVRMKLEGGIDVMASDSYTIH